MKKTIAVLGAGNFGTVCAKFLAENGHDVKIWNWEGDQEPLREIGEYHENKTYLPGIALPENIIPKFSLEDALRGADIVCYAVASTVLKNVFLHSVPFLEKDTIIVSLTKGMDKERVDIFPHIFAAAVDSDMAHRIITISGPAIAGQLAQKNVTVMAIAGKDPAAVSIVKEVCDNAYLQLIPTDDIIGVELGGAFKNVYAIALGMCDGLGLGLNSKSALLAMAINEMAMVSVAMGGKPETLSGVAGLGDVIGTALSPESRNRRFGECLGKGMNTQKACEAVQQTVEGIESTAIFLALAKKHGIATPIATLVQRAVDGEQITKENMFTLFTV